MIIKGKSNLLRLVAAVSLIVFQTGVAMAENAKAEQKNDNAAKASASSEESAPAKQKEETKTSPSDPVVKVNGTVITRGEVDRASKVLSAQSRHGMTGGSQAAIPENVVLDQLVSTELLYQAGEKLKIDDLDKQVAARVAEGRSKFPDEKAYENALKSADLTPKSLENEIRKGIVINNYILKEIVPKSTVSDEESKKFYDENKEKFFKKPEQVRASHILCGVDPKASKEEKEKAKQKAEELLKEIKAGKDFAELAKKNSSCPSKDKGGDLGFFSKGQMVPAFESAAFALKPGEISNVVETQFGYHIIKLTEKKEGGIASYDEEKGRIQDYLKNTKIQKGVQDNIAQLKEKAKIEKISN